MKYFKSLIIATFLILFSSAQAQVAVNVNLGSPPVWGPAITPEVEYYYLPDVESYYDIRASRFIYRNNGVWIRSKSLPVRYRSYDLYKGRTVIINDYRGPKPYYYFKKHKVKYYKGNGIKIKKEYAPKREKHKDFDNHHDKHDEKDKGKGNGKGNGKGKH